MNSPNRNNFGRFCPKESLKETVFGGLVPELPNWRFFRQQYKKGLTDAVQMFVQNAVEREALVDALLANMFEFTQAVRPKRGRERMKESRAFLHDQRALERVIRLLDDRSKRNRIIMAGISNVPVDGLDAALENLEKKLDTLKDELAELSLLIEQTRAKQPPGGKRDWNRILFACEVVQTLRSHEINIKHLPGVLTGCFDCLLQLNRLQAYIDTDKLATEAKAFLSDLRVH